VPYIVDYHLVQFQYFDSNEAVPKGSDYAAIWKGLARFGKRKVSGCFWRLNEAKFAKARRIHLGDAKSIEALISADDAPLFGGGCETRKDAIIPNRDSDFHVSMLSELRSKAGPALPSFQMAVSHDWLSTIEEAVLIEILRDNYHELDRCSPRYGFVELAVGPETYAGLAYSPVISANAPLSRLVDEAIWARGISLGLDRVRSIYWGNYLGPRLLEKLGGKASFLNDYEKQTLLTDGTHNGVVWDFPNGAFVSLTNFPRDLAPGNACLVAERNLLWLRDRLCDGGVL